MHRNAWGKSQIAYCITSLLSRCLTSCGINAAPSESSAIQIHSSVFLCCSYFSHPGSISASAPFCLFASYVTNWIHFPVCLVLILLLTQLFDVEECLHISENKLHDKSISCKEFLSFSHLILQGKKMLFHEDFYFLGEKKDEYFCLNYNSLWKTHPCC